MKNSGDLKLAHEDSISILQAVEVDRIIALPDEILCHILSFLIPLCSVRSTVLSKRWNKLWTCCITNLDFDIKDFSSSYESNYHIFVRFVDQVLAFRDSSLDITRFRVAWEDCEDFSIIDRWIQVAVNANVVDLDVSSYVYPFELPSCVYTCKSLVSLKVKSDYLTFYSLPKTGSCFPNLKFLHYISGYDFDCASGANLFRSCPILEELTIEAHHKKRVLNFDISAPELRTLTTIMKKMNKREHYEEDEFEEDYEEDYRIDPCNFFIDAPKLENLCVKGEVMSKYNWKNTSSLVQARVQLQVFNEASACCLQPEEQNT
ncbi:PREDICTED: putative F-box/LRR-repeat protein At5g41840 [Fragaria vesca subsp. vesca]|uniref:putative F-box/LRR-repeat protein At5g41840 n=1 Tax=Fragaria vesca subsp. vesca TaxID=101020 RepID=UPI0002C30C17|nr:PREDICTED: putative F-box/LRR-repeat protein At5g41840 [Fragaria vesca subsp. vesca]